MKLAYCIHGLYELGGMERVVILKANYFAEKYGYEVHLILTDGKDEMVRYPLHPSIKIHHLNLNYDKVYDYPPLRRMLHVLRLHHWHKRRLTECLNEIKPDITAFTIRREVRFLPSLHDGSIKIAETHFDKEHYMGLPPYWSRFLPGWARHMYRKRIIGFLRRLDKLVVLTYEDEKTWSELSNVMVIPNPITAIPNGVSSCENKRVIALGRYEYQKGFDILLDAWRIVTGKHPDWTLYIYGDGSLRDELEQQRKSLGLENSCFLEHTVKQISECLKNSSLLVLSSRYEGFGLVLVEAMSYGLPVVSFACPCGPKDIIRDGEDGFLVEPNNVEELASKISYLIENNEVRKRMGHQASINVQRYGIEQVAALWKKLFEGLLKEKNNR